MRCKNTLISFYLSHPAAPVDPRAVWRRWHGSQPGASEQLSRWMRILSRFSSPEPHDKPSLLALLAKEGSRELTADWQAKVWTYFKNFWLFLWSLQAWVCLPWTPKRCTGFENYTAIRLEFIYLILKNLMVHFLVHTDFLISHWEFTVTHMVYMRK